MKTKIKVCGMKNPNNIQEIINLGIDFIGFIFHKPSARYIQNVPKNIKYNDVKKVGVFVNLEKEIVKQKAENFNLDFLQLHGNESVDYCRNLRSKGFKIIKVFSVDDNFDFAECEKYLEVSDLFLFDTKGKNPGGNGFVFNWEKLDKYKLSKNFLLSGGIGWDNLEDIKNFNHPNCIGVDLNSGFETSPGMKNKRILKKFIDEIRS